MFKKHFFSFTVNVLLVLNSEHTVSSKVIDSLLHWLTNCICSESLFAISFINTLNNLVLSLQINSVLPMR